MTDYIEERTCVICGEKKDQDLFDGWLFALGLPGLQADPDEPACNNCTDRRRLDSLRMVRHTKFSDELVISGPYVHYRDSLAWRVTYLHPDDTRPPSEIHREEFYDDAEKWCEGWSAAWKKADILIEKLKAELIGEGVPF